MVVVVVVGSSVSCIQNRPDLLYSPGLKIVRFCVSLKLQIRYLNVELNQRIILQSNLFYKRRHSKVLQ